MQEQYEIKDADPVPEPVETSQNGASDVGSIFSGGWFINRRGTFAWNFGFPAAVVTSRSRVAVSITEVNAANVPFLGNAGMSVLNVVPQDDGTITVRANVAWDSPLNVKLSFIIVN